MKQVNHAELAKYGVHLPMVQGLLEPHELAMDYSMAMDAQPTLATTTNGGIPAFLTNYMDPQIIEILFAPNKGAAILGEAKRGDWTTQTSMFPVVESTGEVSSYGDFNENGSSDANINWENRQSYLFQTITQWGELELDRAAEAKINWAQQQNAASVKILDKFMNTTYFVGVSGLANYGLLNDPNLSASLTPATKTAGGTTWAVATAAEIYTDIVSMWLQAQTQLVGLVDRESRMVLATTPEVEANLTKTNQYNVNVSDQIKKNFPNLRIETAVQYAVTGGNLAQLIVEEVEGEEVGFCGFNEKLRAHPIKVDLSSFKQKKSSGTWGAIIKRPMAFVQMLGV